MFRAVRSLGRQSLLAQPISASFQPSLLTAAAHVERQHGLRSTSTQASGSNFIFAPTREVKYGAQLDTALMVREIEDKLLMDRERAEALVDILKITCEETVNLQRSVFSTKEEVVAFKAELQEKVFNATLKLDVSKKHMRELLEKDFQALKSDLSAMEKQDLISIKHDLNLMEKEFLQKLEERHDEVQQLHLDIERLEKRFIQYGMGFFLTLGTFAMAVMRILL